MTFTEEHTAVRRLVTYIVLLFAAAYVYSQIPWDEWWRWVDDNWPSIRAAAIIWVLSGIFHVTLTVFALAILRSGHEADERAEKSLNRLNRCTTRIKERSDSLNDVRHRRPLFGGWEVEK